jgi:hypothetical protein
MNYRKEKLLVKSLQKYFDETRSEVIESVNVSFDIDRNKFVIDYNFRDFSESEKDGISLLGIIVGHSYDISKIFEIKVEFIDNKFNST